jgi:hypothetical protein
VKINAIKARWFVVILLIVGSGFRMMALEQTPPGFYLDEASNSYDAYTLWYTGRDQHGTFLPWALRAFHDYRSPLFSYVMAPWVGLGGLSVLTARLTSAYWGILSLAALYWVGSMLFNRAVGLMATVFLAIAPWHIHFSRLAIEVNLAALFVLLALGMFYRWQRKPESTKLWVAALISGLGLYTYASVKMTLPVMIGIMALVNWKKLVAHPRDFMIALSLGGLLAAPVLYLTLSNPELMQDHFRQISILTPDRPAGAVVKDFILNFWANLSPRYLFQEGSLDIVMHPPGMGQLFRVQAIFLVLGGIWLIKCSDWRLPGGVTLLWIVSSILPAAFTRHALGTGHAQRTYPVVIAWQLLSAVGFVGLYQGVKHRLLKIVTVLITAIWLFGQGWVYYSYYFTDYADDAASSFFAGVDDLVHAVDAVDDNYHAVYYTTYGNDLPYIHFLFYSRYDPIRLLDTPLETDPAYPDRVIGMGKYTFTDQAKDIYLSGLPGLYVLPTFDLPAVPGLNVIPDSLGRPQYKLVGRDRLLLGTTDWLGQCTYPVSPLTYAMVAPPDESLWLANFDCNTAWIYPQAGSTPIGYIFHQDMAAQMNDFTRRHIAGSQVMFSLTHQIRNVGAFVAYEQHAALIRPSQENSMILASGLMPEQRAGTIDLPVLFNGTLAFIGTRVYSDTEQMEIETWWDVVGAPITRPISIMAHGLDESGNLIANADGLGLSPVVLRVGDYVVQRHVFKFPISAQPSWLRLGVYWLDTMERWSITGHEDTDSLLVPLLDNE